MKDTVLILTTAAALAIIGAVPLAAQGNSGKAERPTAERPQNAGARGQGNAQRPAEARGQAARPDQNRGQGNAARGAPGAQGRGGPPADRPGNRVRRGGPAPDRAVFNRDLVDRAVKVRGARQGGARGVEVRREGGQLRVVRNDGALLFAIDQDHADEIGYWRIGRLPWVSQARPGGPDRPDRDRGERDREDRDRQDRGSIFPDDPQARSAGSPAFCRSGEGHPVWGRAWCADKGFGLGDNDRVWGWGRDIEDIVLRRPDYDRDLDRGRLADVLGDIVFGRIALQSLVLGADEPLTGTWLGQPDGPRVLRIHAGDLPVAELVDRDRDDEIDVILFNLGR
jgi:hypothetical protein